MTGVQTCALPISAPDPAAKVVATRTAACLLQNIHSGTARTTQRPDGTRRQAVILSRFARSPCGERFLRGGHVADVRSPAGNENKKRQREEVAAGQVVEAIPLPFVPFGCSAAMIAAGEDSSWGW